MDPQSYLNTQNNSRYSGNRMFPTATSQYPQQSHETQRGDYFGDWHGQTQQSQAGTYQYQQAPPQPQATTQPDPATSIREDTRAGDRPITFSDWKPDDVNDDDNCFFHRHHQQLLYPTRSRATIHIGSDFSQRIPVCSSVSVARSAVRYDKL